jgi:hypothetical protein
VRSAPFADPAAIRLMAYFLTWLPGVLLDAGLTVAEQPGWENRGRGEIVNRARHTRGSRVKCTLKLAVEFR